MFIVTLLLGCTPVPEPVPGEAEDVIAEVVLAAPAPLATGDCSKALNVCPDYAPAWTPACPPGLRCLAFTNASPTETVALSYQIGCNGDGTKGAPQCDCTPGPALTPGMSMYFTITNGDYTSCLPSWQPACLTAGLAVLANVGEATCTKGTRVEFTAGNAGDPYGKADFWNVDVEKDWYSVPVAMVPDITCAVDHENHDCRPLLCDSATCPDAYATPTTGGCPDGRSPQDACQDTFGTTTNGKAAGVTITYFPTAGKSCQDAVACPPSTP
jgi:hypothetical protein